MLEIVNGRMYFRMEENFIEFKSKERTFYYTIKKPISLSIENILNNIPEGEYQVYSQNEVEIKNAVYKSGEKLLIIYNKRFYYTKIKNYFEEMFNIESILDLFNLKDELCPNIWYYLRNKIYGFNMLDQKKIIQKSIN